ncbi:PREDICTED: F-box/FBD/LRR-repeat protein At1g13570-like [Ipomoea nil]|uniref:F-box/FBD/LRR-repeat protein At1g13570-like n=1 Tax=Ipomoea nil TaxID=35883 RepID=UPI000901E37A|nr:PREDICTED: F-box/FBD/LRR-repeat protein At1g13570-like [Ipomoea nil]XP_019176016.1 PREDICTED: F-box/FBD/LRR-repeat protein At1g13570-like [Ipomoea nil]XP_019176023.1 PREDICTED: F-box/FBD/LRR-repeat protein At1g13570-like [Ipomoea nil]XP_019176032.1 PREDICTED: F-box/FBD/LRR-repeat protein At1g13570-like [Ipomoea nil]
MAQRRRIETLPDASRDLISHLPVEINVRILECLPIRDAARTALLSTHWNDVWLQHGQLAFDLKFFFRLGERKGRSRLPYVKIITYILLQRVRPVKKFSLAIGSLRLHDPKLEQSDLDQWFLFLSRNGVEELSVSHGEGRYKLPLCIVSCPTIKQLTLCSMSFDFPLNAPCIFPCVTSLAFSSVYFNHNVNGIVYSIPNLEKLDLIDCEGINNFKISAPKLESLSICGTTMCSVEWRWFALHLKAIKVLCIDGDFLYYLKDVEVASFPTAINLQVIKLYSLEFAIEKELEVVLQLLQKSPNLCELEITGAYSDDDIEDEQMEDDDIEAERIEAARLKAARIEAASRLLKDPESCIISQDLKMLKTIEIGMFCGSTIEMLFVKMLLSKSPILEKVVITEAFYIKDGCMVIKFLRELLCFPRASPKAQIVIKGKDYA